MHLKIKINASNHQEIIKENKANVITLRIIYSQRNYYGMLLSFISHVSN